MHTSEQPLHTAGQVRELDRIAIEEGGIDAYTLMRRAGRAAYRLLRYRFPRLGSVAIYCGSGNNGGDGYVLGRFAREAGLVVRLVATGEPKTDTARRARADFEADGGTTERFDAATVPVAELLVDGLLGTGLARAPTANAALAIERINAAGRPVLALDIPSGLHADSGRALEPCVVADATVTFIGRKLGCHTADGPARAGDVFFDDLGVPAALRARVEARATIIDPRPLAARLRARPATLHKGQAGQVLIVGGNHGMPGAPCLAARAAQVSGAGLVRLATRSPAPALVANSLETMAACIDDGPSLQPLLESADVVAIGPGLGRDTWAQQVWQQALDSDRPLLVDADALTLLAADPLQRRRWILTPHPGEAARLLDTTAAAVQRDRPAAAQAIQARYGGVVVLKGPGTLVQGRALRLCERGNAGMASGGMGDVLSGIIAALWAQGGDAESAAAYGVWCHALAAQQAAPRGLVGLTATALTARLPDVVGAPLEYL